MANPDRQSWSVDQVLDLREYDRCRGVTKKRTKCQNPLSEETRDQIATLLPEVNRANNNADRLRLRESLFQVAKHALCYRDHRPREDLPLDQRRNQQRDNLLERLMAPFDLELDNVPENGGDFDDDDVAEVEDQAGTQITSSSSIDSILDDYARSATPALDADADDIRHEDDEEFREDFEGSFHNDGPIDEQSQGREQSEDNGDVESVSRHNVPPDWEDSSSYGFRRSARSYSSPSSLLSNSSAGRRRPRQPENSVPRRPSRSPPHISPQPRYPRLRRPHPQPEQPRRQGPWQQYSESDGEGDTSYGSDGFDETDRHEGDDDYDEENDPYGAAIDRNRFLENSLRGERSLVQLLLEEHTDIQSAQVRFSRVRDAYYRHAQGFSDHQPLYSQRYGGDILRSRDLDRMSHHREDFHHNGPGPRFTRPTSEPVVKSYQTPPHSRRANRQTSSPSHPQHDRPPSSQFSSHSPPVRSRNSRTHKHDDLPQREHRYYGSPGPSATNLTPRRPPNRRRDGRTEREI